MRAIARKPRVRKPRIGQPKWLERLEHDIAAADRNPQYVKALREIRAEMKAIEATASEMLVKATARQTALVAYLDGATFSAGLNGGVNRHKKRLHELTEQRSEQYAALLSLRLRLGLDAETISRPQNFSDAFKRLAMEPDEQDHAVMMERLREARQRSAAHEAEQREADIARRVAAELAKRGIHEPAALLEGPNPSPTVPEPDPSPPPELSLAPDPEPPTREPEVEDLGNPKPAPVIPPSSITVSVEPRQQILRNARISRRVFTDSEGYILPHPDSL